MSQQYNTPQNQQSYQPNIVVNVHNSAIANAGTSTGNSYFDGGLLQLIGWQFLGIIVCAITFGICAPWAICRVYGWKINHTVINGNRLKFNGTATSLFGHWVKWLLLTIITLGIYAFWLQIKLEQWKVKNTSL